MSIEGTRKRRNEQAQAKQPATPTEPLIDLVALRQLMHEVIAAELEEAQPQPLDLSAITAGLQRIYTELAEMRVLLKHGAGVVVHAQVQSNDDQAAPIYEEYEEQEGEPEPRRQPQPYILGDYAKPAASKAQEVRQ